MVPHCRKVLAGEYLVPGMREPKTILDIGANIGAFSVWALSKWPDARVVAYEPWPSNAEMFRGNLGDRTAVLVEAAVFADGQLEMYPGANNCGECSLWRGSEQSSIERRVAGVSPTHLDACDFLKVDTEGAELAILSGYRHLATVQAVALETHSERDAWVIRQLLAHEGLTRVTEDVWRPDRSVQRWLRKA